MNILQEVKRVAGVIKRGAVKHSPVICLGVGIGGMAAAIIWGIKETPKAVQAVEKRKEELNVTKLTKGDTFKVAWKYYIPTTVLFALSTACLISGNRISARRNAALAAAYSVSETALRQYKEAIEEKAPEVKQKIEETVAQKQLDEAPQTDISMDDVTVIDNGGDLVYDPLTRSYFKIYKEKIQEAANTLGYSMLSDGFAGTASLNDFYDILGIPTCKLGDDVGWNISNNEGIFKTSFIGGIARNGKPCLVLTYDKPPKHEFLTTVSKY